MASLLFRTLLVPCCLALTLPPGWCCSLPGWCPGGEQQGKAPAPAPAKGCCCCHEERRPSAPAPALPKQPVKSCCQSQPTAPPTHNTFHLDLPLVGLAVLPEDSSVRHAPGRHDAEGPPVLPSRLHLLQCVWLC